MPPKAKSTSSELKRYQHPTSHCDMGVLTQVNRCYCVRADSVSHYCARHCEMKMIALCERQARCSVCVPTRMREQAPVSTGRPSNGRRASKANKKESKKVFQAQRPQEHTQNKRYFGCQRDSRARTRTPKHYKQ